MALIIGSAFKIASSVGVAGVSVVSVPVTISVVGSARAQSLFDLLNKGVENIKTLVTDSMNGFENKLSDEYSKFGNKVKDDYEEYLEKNLDTLKAIGPIAQTAQELLKEYGESINYYAFELGVIVGEVLKTVPTILKDSALEAKSEGKATNLLSLQKIMKIAKSEKLPNFVVGIMQAMAQHQSLISGLSSKDVQGVIQIFRELPQGDINSFLEGVQANASNLDKESSSYCSSTKLMLHLLLGKDKIEGIATSIKNLEDLLKNLKDAIEKIEGIGEGVVAELEQQLQKISNEQTIKDPCSQKST